MMTPGRAAASEGPLYNVQYLRATRQTAIRDITSSVGRGFGPSTGWIGLGQAEIRPMRFLVQTGGANICSLIAICHTAHRSQSTL